MEIAFGIGFVIFVIVAADIAGVQGMDAQALSELLLGFFGM